MSTEAKTQWHPAFCAAMRLDCLPWQHELEFTDELRLGQLPNIIDMLVIKKRADVVLPHPLLKSFRGHNILEFKSPEDELNIDNFFKGLGYACDYKSQGAHVDERKYTDITITFLRESPPAKLLQMLASQGVTINNPEPGIYTIEKFTPFFTQIVAYKELADPNALLWVRSLTRNLSEDDALRLVDAVMLLDGEEGKKLAEAVAHVAVLENLDVFSRMRKEDNMVKVDAFKVIFKDDFERTRVEGEVRGEARGIIKMGREFGLNDTEIVNRLSSNLKCTLAEAERMFRDAEASNKMANAI